MTTAKTTAKTNNDKNNNDNAYNKVARLGKDGDSTEALQDSFELGS